MDAFFIWRRRRDSQGSALRSLREQPIVFGFAEWSSSLSWSCCFFGGSISLFPSCGAQRNLRAARMLDFFDRYANSHSLYRPQGAVVLLARAGTVARFRFSLQSQTKKASRRMPFCLAQKERLELSRRFPDLRP